jgi:hypothetical protein
MKPSRLAAAIVVIDALLVVLYWTLYAYDPVFHNRYIRNEDRATEWITFAGFFFASLLRAGAALRRAPRPRLATLYLAGLAFFFFVCAGEELSWGQRVFGFKTPDAIKRSNEQKEFNLHNLDVEHFHPVAVVSAFMKVFGILLPLACWWRRRAGDAPWRRFLPAPAVVAAFVFPEVLGFLVGHLKPAILERWSQHVWTLIRLDTNEMIEMFWGLAVLLAAGSIYQAWASQARRRGARA